MKSFFSSAMGLLALGLFLNLPAVAQPGSGGPTPGNPDPIQTPLDGGASLLLAGGVAYGLKQIRARRQARRAAKQTPLL